MEIIEKYNVLIEDLEQVKSELTLQGATSITEQEQPDKTYDIIAVFDDTGTCITNDDLNNSL